MVQHQLSKEVEAMAEKTKIGMHLEEESKPLKKMCEKLMDTINHELDKSIENINTQELGEAIDMVKDLYEAKKEMYEACYYKQVMEAMEEHDFEDEEEIMNEGRRGYRGQPRDSMGRYTSRGRGRGGRRGYEEYMPPIYYEDPMMRAQYERDMDMNMGRMYYSESSNSGRNGNSGSQSGGNYSSNSGGSNRTSRYGFAHDEYMEKREKHSKPEDHAKRMELLNDYIEDLEQMAKDVIKGMSPEEKQTWKVKLSKIINM